MTSVALIKSDYRCKRFQDKLLEYGCEILIVDFDDPSWTRVDLNRVDFLIFYPTWESSSNRPDALNRVKHNLMHIHRCFPNLPMYPDPNVIPYYNDKYAQFLFLTSNRFPIPKTVVLDSHRTLESIEGSLGYPCIVKNRYGAGGNFVFLVNDDVELRGIYDYSRLTFSSKKPAALLLKRLLSRSFLRAGFGAREAVYPFLSFPLLAQKFIPHDKDLKIVVGDYTPIEGHWRKKPEDNSWKMNIDGGGIGEWSYVPEEVKSLAVRLAKSLKAKWLNIDFMFHDDKPLISEFSPVWHHYAQDENKNFVYKDDYNFDIPAAEATDLEELIVSSYYNKTIDHRN